MFFLKLLVCITLSECHLFNYFFLVWFLAIFFFMTFENVFLIIIVCIHEWVINILLVFIRVLFLRIVCFVKNIFLSSSIRVIVILNNQFHLVFICLWFWKILFNRKLGLFYFFKYSYRFLFVFSILFQILYYRWFLLFFFFCFIDDLKILFSK